jgi:hypothetical protein
MKSEFSPESVDATTGSGGAIAKPLRSPAHLPGRRVPADQIKELNDDFKAIIELMVHGQDKPTSIEGVQIAAGFPLTLNQAARLVGVRVRRAREVSATALFQGEFNKELIALRNAEKPRNLRTAIEIRDDEGDGSAATKTVRLKAIASIEGKAEGGSTVNVQINQQTVNQVSPGYVIRLDDPAPRIDEAAAVIEQASE